MDGDSIQRQDIVVEGGCDHAQRFFAHDFARVIAMVFVIGVHARSVFVEPTGIGAIVVAIISSIVFTCNPIFFMLSGRFNIRKQKTRASFVRWYIRKTRNLLIPILIYFLIRTLYEVYSGTYSSALGLTSIVRAFAYNVSFGFASTEYWFIYSLISVLLVAPLFAKMIDTMTDYECKALVLISLGFNLVQTIMMNAGFSFGWSYVFKDYAFYFLLGAVLPRLVVSERQKLFVKAFALFGVLATALFSSLGFASRAFDTSPVFTLASVGVYYVLLDIGNAIGSCRVVTFVARHSLGVYLVHMVFLQQIVSVLESLWGPNSDFLIYGSAVVLSVLFSIGFALLVDNILVKPAQLLFDKALSRLSEASC